MASYTTESFDVCENYHFILNRNSGVVLAAFPFWPHPVISNQCYRFCDHPVLSFSLSLFLPLTGARRSCPPVWGPSRRAESLPSLLPLPRDCRLNPSSGPWCQRSRVIPSSQFDFTPTVLTAVGLLRMFSAFLHPGSCCGRRPCVFHS